MFVDREGKKDRKGRSGSVCVCVWRKRVIVKVEDMCVFGVCGRKVRKEV